MGVEHLSLAIQSLLCLVLLAVLFLELWPALRLDTFRQGMFTVRDELFDYAASGAIPFDDPAYRLLRQLMNGLIRYGHQITFFRLWCTFMRLRLSRSGLDDRWSAKWEVALGRIRDLKVRDDLCGFHSRASELVAARIVYGSPALLLLLIVLFTTIIVRRGLQNLKHALTDAVAAGASLAVDQRLLEDKAAKLAA